MSHLIISTPDPSEYAPYFGRYIALVHDKDIINILGQQINATLTFLRSLPDSKGDYRYAPDKWNVKEVLTHMIDCERVFAYRALSFSRNDAAPLPGFEQDDWMKATALDGIPLKYLVNEFEHLRQSNLSFFRHLSQEAWMRRGTASGNPFTVRALAYVIAGHELHHLHILKSQYS